MKLIGIIILSDVICTLSYWNETGCEGKQGTPIMLVGAEESDCEALIIVPSTFDAPGNEARETAKSVKVTC